MNIHRRTSIHIKDIYPHTYVYAYIYTHTHTTYVYIYMFVLFLVIVARRAVLRFESPTTFR